MYSAANLLKLTAEGLFSTSDEFDFAVGRFNQDQEKLVVLARRNSIRIHNVCLGQAREKTRITKLNKGKKGSNREQPRVLCSSEWVAV